MLVAAVLACCVVLGGCWLLYKREAGQIAQSQADREVTRVNLLSRVLQSELRPVADDLRLLIDGDGLRAYLQTGEATALQAAIRRAKFISERKPDYDKVRFLDETGQEVFRINRHGQVVPATDLQNKAERGFFRETNQLPAGGLFLSAFDLNMEWGRIETPLKPTLRFAAPVFDEHGRRRGIYVINYLGADLIERLQRLVPVAAHRLRLLNPQGYWLKAADPAQEWGFMLAERSQFTLARTNPQLWRRIQQETEGQVRAPDGLFTWRRLSPPEFSGVSDPGLRSEESGLIMASEVVPSEWTALFTGLRQTLAILAAALVLLALSTVWLFSSWRGAIRNLRQKVRERTAELEQSYEQLSDREQLLEEMGSLANVGGWEFDPATGRRRWTTEVSRIYGLDPTLPPDKSINLDYYPGESRVRLESAMQKSLAEGVPYDLELEFVSDSGERKWVRAICRPRVKDGKVVLMRGTIQDVTARKEAEFKLRAQLQRLHLLEQITRAIGEHQDLSSILQITVGAVETEMPVDFACIGLYDAMERRLKITAVAPASFPLAAQMAMAVDATVPIDENGLSQSVRGELVYEPDVAQVDFPFPRQLNGAGLRALVIAPLQIESKVFGVLIAARRRPESFSSGECEFLRQLSEHVALAAHQAQLNETLRSTYEDLRSTQQAVMQQERLRVLGQMASGIAHDINNAISPIMLYTESLIEQEPGLSERARSSLSVIQQAVSDVAETVARMREFYRQRDPELELQPVQVNDLVHQVIELTRARWEAIPQQRGVVISMETALAPGLPPVKGIESEIREALTNLIFNAVDAMPEGGVLTLRTRLDDQKSIMVEVVDTGIGMNEDTRRRCLEPFFTTKGERGTGLGLAMVYGVMQRHGGKVDIRSAPGQGTTFLLSFVPATAAPKPATDAGIEVPTGLTILLVDDDPVVLKSLRETLELDGQTILTANGGQQGINLFASMQRERGPDAISVVITDLGMPHVDGRSVANAIKAQSPQTPVIMLTGWGERLLAEGHKPANVDRVLSKPPRIKALRTALSELWPVKTDR